MRIINLLRLLLGSFLVLFVIITVISLFFPSRVRISRAMNVQASEPVISAHIADMRRWKEWNPFLEEVADSNLHFLPSGESVPGSMRVNDISVSWLRQSGTEWVAEIKGLRGRPVKNGWQLIHHAGSDSTTIQWYMDFSLRWYPWEKFSSLLLEKTYGASMEKGLVRLRQSIYTDQSSQ